MPSLRIEGLNQGCTRPTYSVKASPKFASAVAEADSVSTNAQRIQVKAHEDLTRHIAQLTVTMSTIKAESVTTTQDKEKGVVTKTTTKALLHEPVETIVANRKKDRAAGTEGQRPELWQLTVEDYGQGRKSVEILAREYSKYFYEQDQYRARIDLYTPGKPNPHNYTQTVHYRFPWSGSNYSKVADGPVEVADAKLKKTLFALADRLEDKTKTLSGGQKLHRLFTRGYWNP